MENNRREAKSSMDVFTAMDCADDPFSISALLSLDNYPDLFSPFGYSSPPFNYSSSNWTSLASPNASADIDTLDSISPTQGTRSRNFTSTSPDVSDDNVGSVIPKPMVGTISLAEKMLKALSLFKESSGGGILAQVWMPVKNGNAYVLSTSEQPFLLDQILAGYREISRGFTFSAEEAPGLFPGLPGRVFISGLPEWTSNVGYYSKLEYLRADYANSHEVRGSLAVPIFNPKERSCCAVLELVTKKEKADFDMEMESVCNALQAVDLKTIKGQAYQQIIMQTLTEYQKSAFNEILDVLRACCHAHMLPLALTWVPLSYNEELNSSLRQKTLLCIQDSACYVTDTRMNGFLHACAQHRLEKGQGIAGKALQSNHPFFSPDVKGYNIREYPLAHHARKYGLNAAVAIRLRSTLTGNDDYILEFFLPVNCRGSSEQQELLNNLSTTMQRICRTLRTVSDAEMVDANSTKRGANSTSPEISIRHFQQIDNDNEMSTDLPSEDPNTRCGQQGDSCQKQLKAKSSREQEKKRSTVEKNISMSVLQQYFSGSLKDAAKCIGVCPTTLKRICRQHGISRWPSRKINKVNRTLKKIQTVIDSVQGVDGSLKYDPETGRIVASVSAEKSTTMPSSVTSDVEAERFVKKLEFDSKGSKGGLSLETFECQIASKSSGSMTTTDDANTKLDINVIKENSHPTSSSMTDSSSGSASSFPTLKKSSKEKTLASDVDCSNAITVKATYKEDMVRFKFVPSMGCQQLFEEIGKRYKLSIGTFQLKYMDDEEEWVMLSNNSDLIECVEVLESMGSRNLRLLVRDVACSFGSSGGSNYLQA